MLQEGEKEALENGGSPWNEYSLVSITLAIHQEV